MSPEMMDVDGMETLLLRAYNGVTFRNALLCALDWCNWYHCVNIHKDTDLCIDPDTGKIVDAYTKVTKTWLTKNGLDIDTVNPSNPGSGITPFRERFKNARGADVKIKKIKDYSKYHSYEEVQNPSGNPKVNGWYEKSSNSDNYWLTIDTYVVSTKTYYRDIGANPWHEHWYEVNQNNVALLTEDTSVDQSKVYYEESASATKYAYFVTTDTHYDETKKYYHYKANAAEMVSLPDYTSKYERNFDIDNIRVLKEEVTLENKRPVMEEI